MHYQRLRLSGDPLVTPASLDPKGPRYKQNNLLCAFDGCENQAMALFLCTGHRRQQENGEELRPLRKLRPRCSGQLTPKGYIILTKNGRRRGEHVWVMEEHLGRELIKPETVHHKNGQRAENNLGNLELWSSAQPPGQRVKDKLKWMFSSVPLYQDTDDIAEAMYEHVDECEFDPCIICKFLKDVILK